MRVTKTSAGVVVTISLLAVAAVTLGVGRSSDGFGGPAAADAVASAAFGAVELSFEANGGQAPDGVKYLARGAGYSVYLTPTGALLALGQSAGEPVQMKLVGADPDAPVSGHAQVATTSNYLLDDARGGHRTGVPHYAKVRYEDVYSGVDLVFHGNQRQLEYDFVVAPGVDTDTIRLRLEGVEQLALDGEGGIVARVGAHQLVHRAPVIYQELGGTRRHVAGGYELAPDGGISFHIGAYDHPPRPLVIDPVISYGTYLGGSSLDYGHDIAVGADGSAYVTGVTYSTDFPVTAPQQDAKSGLTDAFVAKLDPTGSQFVYVTYLGGSAEDTAWGIDVDAAGSALVAGTTWSTDFPGVDGAVGGASDAFLAKLSPAGDALEYARYIGGSGDEEAAAIVVDDAQRVTVVGSTASADFPTLGAVDDELGGRRDAFVTQVDENGAMWSSTFFGGSGEDRAVAVANGSQGVFISGTTSSVDLATGEAAGSFAAKLLPEDPSVAYVTYLGDPAARTNLATGIGIDASENAYIPATSGAGGETGDLDVVVSKLDPEGAVVGTATFGSTGEDYGAGIAVDSLGDVYLSGTASGDFGDFAPLPGPAEGSAFVAVIDPNLTLTYFSRFGGGGEGGAWGRGRGTALDRSGALYITGDTSASDFPTSGAPQPQLAGLRDAFIVKADFGDPEPQPPETRDDYAETTLREPVTIAVLDNDSSSTDPLDPASVEIITQPTSGTAVVDSTTGQIVYTPGRGFLGSDQFEYRVCAGGLCSTAEVFVDVLPPACTVIASPGVHLVIGTRANDVICGGDRTEVFLALAGDDVVLGGGGDDIILGSRGADVLYGDDGDDVISGGQNADVLAGGEGDDVLIGDGGDDLIIDGPGNDLEL